MASDPEDYEGATKVMKCKMKSASIDADQFFPDCKPWPKGVREVTRMTPDGDFQAFIIQTPSGPRSVRPGDWVVQNPKGDSDSYSDSQFKELYEIVSE